MYKDLGILQELCAIADSFAKQGIMPPTGYKQKSVNWIIEIDRSGQVSLQGPFQRGDTRKIYAPDRYRSGPKAPPYLLLDKASYVLGVAKSTGDKSLDDFHASFIELLEQAFKDTQDSELNLVINFLRQPFPSEILEKINSKNKDKKDKKDTPIKPEDLVTIRTKSDEFVFERDRIQEFWVDYLSQEYTSSSEDSCAICGIKKRMLRSLPRPIVVLGQKCQIISFNKTAFFPFGRNKDNVFTPICFRCGLKAIDGLDYLIQTEKHRKTLAQDLSKGKSKKHRKTLAQDLSKGQSKNPLKNQLAVFWVKELQDKSTQEREVADIEVEAALSALLHEEDVNLSKGESEQNQAPPPELSQLENLLKSPWSGKKSSLNLDDKSFNLAVLSPNKARLVIREWISISLKDLQAHLSNFLDSTRIVSPRRENIRSFSIPTIQKALESTDPNLIRALLRTAYQGDKPPPVLLEAALRKFRLPKTHKRPNKQPNKQQKILHILASILKLVLTHGTNDTTTMTQLDCTRKNSAYQCGRLLAICEEAQRRASGNIDTTVVERFYGAASTAPAAYLSLLHTRARTSHLPQIRRKNRGYVEIEKLLQEVWVSIAELGGVPTILMPIEQAEFALGFYCQKANFFKSSKPKTDPQQNDKGE